MRVLELMFVSFRMIGNLLDKSAISIYSVLFQWKRSVARSVPGMFWHVVWNQCLFRVGDLTCLARRTRFDHFVDVMIDITPEDHCLCTKLAFLCTLVCIMDLF